DTRPPTSDTTRPRPNTGVLHPAGRLKDPLGPADAADVTTPHKADDDVLVCCRCDAREAVLWCSQCFSMTCVACWGETHSTAPPRIGGSTVDDDESSSRARLGGCVQTQSLGALHSGPPLPLLRTPPTMVAIESTKVDKKRALMRFRGKSQWSGDGHHHPAADAVVATMHVETRRMALPHTKSLPSLPHPTTVLGKPPEMKAKRPPPVYKDPRGRLPLKQHPVDMSAHLL
ncbi:hypothetical protein As57867_002465, partial [Aphanomyces stellatus]